MPPSIETGHTAREIVKQAHVSFNEIKKIRMKTTGEVNEDDKEKKKSLSVPSQAFKLFLDGKSIVHVAISLDLPTEQVLKIHSNYLILQNMGKTSSLLMENKKHLDAYLSLLNFLNGNNIKVKDLNNAVGLVRNVDSLKKEKAQLEYDVDTLMDEKKWYEKELDEMKREYYKIR